MIPEAALPVIAVAEIPGASAELSPQQIADVETLHIEKRRAERRAVYSLINRHISPGLTLSHRPDGSPLLIRKDGTTYPGHFSLSHCRTAAAIAYHPVHPIGIDIEDSTPRLSRIADKYLSDREKQLLAPLDNKMLLAAWTFKEAAFKSLGDRQLVMSGINIESIDADGSTLIMRATTATARIEGSIAFSPGDARATAIVTAIVAAGQKETAATDHKKCVPENKIKKSL